MASLSPPNSHHFVWRDVMMGKSGKHLICPHGQDRGGVPGVQDGELSCCDGYFMCRLDWATGHPGSWPNMSLGVCEAVPGRERHVSWGTEYRCPLSWRGCPPAHALLEQNGGGLSWDAHSRFSAFGLGRNATTGLGWWPPGLNGPVWLAHSESAVS